MGSNGIALKRDTRGQGTQFLGSCQQNTPSHKEVSSPTRATQRTWKLLPWRAITIGCQSWSQHPTTDLLASLLITQSLPWTQVIWGVLGNSPLVTKSWKESVSIVKKIKI